MEKILEQSIDIQEAASEAVEVLMQHQQFQTITVNQAMYTGSKGYGSLEVTIVAKFFVGDEAFRSSVKSQGGAK